MAKSAKAAKKPAPVYKRVATMTAADRRAVLYSALASVAKKRSNRALLFGGGFYPVDVKITGKCGRGTVNETVKGELLVGEDSVRNSSSACDQAELLACVVAGIETPVRDRIFKTIRETFATKGTLPTVDAAVVAATDALLTELRSNTSETKKGDVTFKPAKEAA